MHKAMEHNVLGSTKPQIKTFSMGDTIFWFPKGRKEHSKRFKEQWFGP
jgi:hypothetical protein